MQNERKTMIVIGAGVAGLSTASYGQMNGYQTKIFEMHSLAGGCCTSWKRKDYIFDWCITWMLGTGPGNEMNQIWMELGALQGKRVVDFDIFNTVIGTQGQEVRFYVDPDRLQEHLLEISPEDAGLIKRFCNDMRVFQKCVDAYPFLKPVGMMTRWERAKMLLGFLRYYRTVMRSHNTLMTDFANKFRNPFLREAMNYIFFDKHPSFPLLPFYFNVASAANRNAGCPEGGSMGLARSIEERYYDLGGEIQFNAKVSRIMVEDDRAVGIELSDGSKHYADIVVSAGDAHFAVQGMLGGKYKGGDVSRVFDELIHKDEAIYNGWVTVFLGVKRDMTKDLHSISYLLNDEEAKQLPGVLHNNFVVQVRNHHFPDISPPGKSVIFASYFSSFDFWNKLSKDGPEMARHAHVARLRTDEYKQAKAQVGTFIIDYLERKFPGLKDQVECIDVSTPLTLVRYTGNHKGSVLAWEPFGEGCEAVEKHVEKYGPTLPGLKNFYMAGHWISTGGVIRAAVSGRHVVQFICRDDRKEFQASVSGKKPEAVSSLELFKRAHRRRAVA